MRAALTSVLAVLVGVSVFAQQQQPAAPPPGTPIFKSTTRLIVQTVNVKDKDGKPIEGLAANGVLHKVQKAWVEHDVPQCGYCQSGMIMAVAALLKEKPKPTDADIDEAITNICRCGTFQQVREAIHMAANA